MKRSVLLISLLALLPTLASVAVLAQEGPPPCIAEWPINGNPMDAIGDAQQDVYVTRFHNPQLLRFDGAGTLLKEWQSQLDNPRGVAVDSQGFVYVGSWNSGKVSKFDSDGSLVLSWVSSGAMYVATDSNDDLWLTSFGENQVRKYDSQGSFQLEWPVNSVSNPRGIDVDSEGNVYVTEQGASRVRKFDQVGNPLHTVGSGFAWDVAVDSQDNAYLAETGRVVKYDADGNYLADWTGCEAGVGTFHDLRGIGVSDSGYLYVADYGGARVSVFGPIAPKVSCLGFEPPLAAGPVTVKGNRALPFKAQLLDGDGNPVTDLDMSAPPVIQVWYEYGMPDADDVTGEALPAGQSSEGNQFFFDSDQRWHYNLKTKNYSALGTYTVLMDSGDASEYVIEPTCTGQFVVK